MNKKGIVLFLVMLMLLCTGCRKNEAEETTIPTETQAASEMAAENQETLGTVPGTAQNVFDSNGFEDEPEETEDKDHNADKNQDADKKDEDADAEKPGESGDETATEPQNTEPEATEPEATEPEGTDPGTQTNEVTYEDYLNMTPEEQMEFYNQFPSMEEFVQWYNEAKAKYDEEHGSIDVGDGNIDMGDIVKP